MDCLPIKKIFGDLLRVNFVLNQFKIGAKMGGNSSTEARNEAVPDSKLPGFTSVYRKKGTKELIHTPQAGIETLDQLLRNTVKKYGPEKGIGQVQVTIEKDQEGKQQQVRTIRVRTYQEVFDTAYDLGKALQKHGFAFKEPTVGMKMVGIYSKNRYEWFVTDWACVLFGITSVPLYDTLGVENLTYCLKQTEITTLFANPDTLKVLLKLKDYGHLQNIISYDKVDSEIQKKLEEHKIKLFYLENLIAEGKTLKEITNEHIVVKPKDCYTFSYTSGTTGPPKGAMISHQNILAFIAGIKNHDDIKFSKEDTYVSYLPLPHIMERTVAMAMFYEGAYLVAASGNTLKLKDDCLIIKPTLIVSVPRIFNRIVHAVKDKFQKETGIKRYLIDWGVSTKLKSAQQNGAYTNFVYDNLIFKKVREGFGGRIRLMASGSAPLSPEVHSYMKALMCCPLIQAYGQTENTASILYSMASDHLYGAMAELSESAQVKLCDIPQMKYTSEDKDEEGRPSPRGQIWIRGPQIFLGYYKMEQTTKDTITEDGWLKTGDIGQVLPDCLYFKIIDRKKNIFKLQQGEYVAPDKVQNIYLKSNFVAEAFLHGQSVHNFAVAIITPDKEHLLKYAQDNKIEGTFEELCRNIQIRKHILSNVTDLGKAEGLYGFEQAKNIYLETEGFASRNIMTNTMKLIRFEARQYYKQIIDDLYKEGELPLK